jgi:hypothetical protein
MASASSVPYPSSRESTNTSFEESSSMGSAPAGFEGAPESSSRLEGAWLKSTDDLATSHAKTFEGTVIRPDAIFVSSFASSLYLRGMWLSSMPKLVLECAHDITVGLHLLIVAARVLHDLVDYEL